MADTAVPAADADAASVPEPGPSSNQAPAEPDLGDAGKKAIDAERQARKAAEKQAKQFQEELETLRQSTMSDAERAVAQARAEARESAFKEVGDRLVRAEIRALAAGKLADPDDAVHLLDTSQFVSSDGTVDSKAAASAIDALLKDKPYLGARPGNGSGEGGPRGRPDAVALNGDPLLRDLKAKLGIRDE